MAMKADETVSLDRTSFLSKKELNVGGVKCKLFNDAIFARLRQETKTPDDFLKDFVWHLDKGGGKGGAKMAFTKDMRFIVKELTGGDSSSLKKHAAAIVEHCTSKKSFLSRILAHFMGPKKVEYIVMAAVIPNVRDKNWDEIYDLKGNRDDKILISSGERIRAVHMRCWTVPYFCCLSTFGCLSKNRIVYYQGKVDAYSGDFFHLTDSAAKLVLERVHNDTKFLAELGLMDYSVILGVRRCSLKDYRDGVFPKGCMVGSDQPYISTHKGEVWAYYLGIIDFLQEWNMGKRVAACLKCMCAPKPLSTVPPKEYAEQFYSHFSEKLSAGVHDAKPLTKSRCPAPSVSSIGSVGSTEDSSSVGSPTSSKGRSNGDEFECKEDVHSASVSVEMKKL